MSLGVQPNSHPCFPHGWLLGKNDRHCKENLGFYVAQTEHSPYLRSAVYINGRSHCHYECTTTCTCVHRPRQPPDPLSIDASHTKDWSPTTSWRLLREGSVHKTVETGPSSRQPVLDMLAKQVPFLLAMQTEMDDTSQRPTSRGCGLAKRQTGHMKLLAYG